MSKSVRKRPTLFVSTGCTSSDILFVPVVEELLRRGSVGQVAGIGGAPLREAGVKLYYDFSPISDVGAVSGLRTVIRHAPKLVRSYRAIASYFATSPPDLAVLVDSSGLNLRLMSLAHKHGVPVLYFIPPETWSLFRWQLRRVVAGSSMLATIYESESEAYRAAGAETCWIGHPLADLLSATPIAPREVPAVPSVGLFPGSRRNEVRRLLPILRESALRIAQVRDSQFIICAANDTVRGIIEKDLANWRVPVELAHRHSHRVLSRCHLVLACSGTATLEAAMLGVPMVAMYQLNAVLDRVIQHLLLPRSRYPFFALPNLLLRREAVPELCFSKLTPANVADEGLKLLTDRAQRARVLADLALVRRLVGPSGATGRAADLVEQMLHGAAERPQVLAGSPKPSPAAVAASVAVM